MRSDASYPRGGVRLLTASAAVLAALGSATWLGGQQKEPYYVGTRVCASCHDGQEMGAQHSLWLLTGHARAYASLATPESLRIAELSGVPGDPQKAATCLGCHATASEAEEWEKDPTFRMEDGVQCEKCHGPGSEYMPDEVMRSREASARAGLIWPKKESCNLCHYVKGSHVKVHHKKPLDLDEAMAKIAHPTRDPSPGVLSGLDPAETGSPDEPRYIGVHTCAGCHSGPERGHQYSRWRLSRHSRAYAILSSEAALEMARAMGIPGDPQRAPECLRCHSTGGVGESKGVLETFSPDEGVGCEACHGPGSHYAVEAIMMDRGRAHASGLQEVTKETCLRCHGDHHGEARARAFDFKEAMAAVAHPLSANIQDDRIRYKNPVNLALTPDGKELYVACEASNSVIVVDVRERRKVAEIPVGGQAHDVAFSPDGSLAYVSNRLDDSVSVVDTSSREVVRTFAVGDEPHGLLTSPDGSRLYVLNTASDSISVLDTGTGEEIKRLAASRNPWSLSLSPDGRHILVTNTLSRFVEFRKPSLSEVTSIDLETGIVDMRHEVPGANLLQGVNWHPSGEFAFITLNRTKNLVPMTRILQGWTITNGLGVVWKDGTVDQVLLDQPNLHFPDAADVAFTPDGRLALVSSSGSDRLAVIDVKRLLGLIRNADPYERESVLPNHLAKSLEFVIKHIPTQASPRGIAVTADGRNAFVTNALDDSLTVVDMERLEAAGRVDLGGPKEITTARWGEQLFHNANITFQRQFSCHSCHPDGHVDGLTYDIEPDGIGLDPVDNRTLRGILDTDPFKWTGKNPSLSRQCGPRLAVFFTRIEPFAPDELAALDEYIATIPRPPNRHRPLGAPLTEAQRRGKKVFERSINTMGKVIPERDRCVTCHFPPLYTDRTVADVGTKMMLDRHGRLDVPHLVNIYDSAPYLHNGTAPSLEEIWTMFNPYDQHGVTNDLTKDELNDLIEYLKTL